jgi:hypothetical protein
VTKEKTKRNDIATRRKYQVHNSIFAGGFQIVAICLTSSALFDILISGRTLSSEKVARVRTYRNSIIVLIFIFISLPIKLAVADEELTLIATLHVGSDSTWITSITPVGDFNADGYDDLLIGEGPRDTDQDGYYEAAHLFYGGPSLDSIPDLVFKGAALNSYCYYFFSCFACQADRLGDFNGDGFDDLAIGAPLHCEDDYERGKVYVYFGGPNPDTSADLVIGALGNHYMGDKVIGGDYDGDGLGDLLVLEGSPSSGSRIFIYLGSNSPDTVHDWLYDYGSGFYTDSWSIFGGHDLTGDACDDFGWQLSNGFAYFFLGGSPIPQNPIDSLDSYPPRLPGDVSEDGIEDFFIVNNSGENYFYLGGNPLDLEPDYYARTLSHVFVYNMNHGVRKLVSVSTFWNRILLYNNGVPLDTIPIDTISIPHFGSLEQEQVGDINADSTDELALLDTTLSYVYLYSILEITSIDREPMGSLEPALLSCYPNPFNDAVIISFSGPVKNGEVVEIEIFNIQGQSINKLKTIKGIESKTTVSWDGTDRKGRKISSGVYILRATTALTTSFARIVYIK